MVGGNVGLSELEHLIEAGYLEPFRDLFLYSVGGLGSVLVGGWWLLAGL